MNSVYAIYSIKNAIKINDMHTTHINIGQTVRDVSQTCADES